MKLLSIIVFCLLVQVASSQVPRDSVILDDVFIVDCACKVDDIIIVDLSSTSAENKAYRLYFQESSEKKRGSRLRKKHLLKINTVIYLYESEFIGSLYGRLVQFPGSQQIVIRFTKGKQKRRVLLGVNYDLLSEFDVTKQCSNKVAYVF